MTWTPSDWAAFLTLCGVCLASTASTAVWITSRIAKVDASVARLRGQVTNGLTSDMLEVKKAIATLPCAERGSALAVQAERLVEHDRRFGALE